MAIATARMPRVPADAAATVLMRVGRRWRVFAAVFLIVAALVISLRFLLVPQFTATSAVLIEPDRSPIERRGAASDGPSADSAEVESQVEMIRSPRLLQAMLRLDSVRAALLRACRHDEEHSYVAKTARFLGRALRYAGSTGGADRCVFDDSNTVVDTVGRSFTIYQVGRSRVVSVSFQSSLPDTASIVVNSLVGEYLADNVRAKSTARMATARWLEDEGLKLRESLDKREREIDSYRREHGLLHGQHALVTQENLTALIGQLSAAKARYADANARSAAATRSGDAPIVAPGVIGSEAIRDMRTLEAGLVKEIGALTARYGDQHPAVIAAKNELNHLRSSVTAESGRIVKSLATETASAGSDEQALQATLNDAKSEAASAADADSAVQSLVRDADIDRQLYFVFASRAKELETETRAQNPSAQLVSLAGVPVKAAFPRTIPFFGAALLLGMVSGAGAAFARDYADKTLRNIGDFTDDVDVPVLARIPVERGLSRLPDFFRTIRDDRSGFKEAIRALYAHIQLRDGMRTLLVTSSSPKEGKTSVSIALAHFAAAAGHRVLLIEADLRMPMFAKLIPVRGEGMHRFFSKSLPDAGLIEVPDSDVPFFHVLPAGRPVQNSTELLSSARMAALLRAVRDRYDLVVIDTPPASYLMDACVLARLADGVIFVARWGQSQPELMRQTMRTISEAGGNIIGTVVGMVERKTYSMYGNSVPIAKRGLR